MRKFLGKAGGRKFIVTVLTLLAMIANGLFGIDIPESTIQAIAAVAGTFVLGQGLADGLSKGATGTQK